MSCCEWCDDPAAVDVSVVMTRSTLTCVMCRACAELMTNMAESLPYVVSVLQEARPGANLKMRGHWEENTDGIGGIHWEIDRVPEECEEV